MKIWLLVLLGCCGCLDDALTPTDLDMGRVDSGPDESGLTICEKSETGKRSIIWEAESVQVECLADYGGGWLLVGRSGRTSDGQFGWLQSQGTLDDPSRAYSLGADLNFIEILVVAGTAGRVAFQDFSEVIELRVQSENFISENAIRPIRPVRLLSYSAGCVGEPNPSAFYALGWTNQDSAFWFGESDGPMLVDTGLYPDGWHFDGTSCERDGNFGDQQGAIYVRALKEKP